VYFKNCKNSSSVFKRRAYVLVFLIKFKTVFVSNRQDFLFSVSPRTYFRHQSLVQLL